MKKIIPLYSLLLSMMLAAGCKKEDDFLSAKPTIRLTTLNSLSDLSALLADEDIMNRRMPGLGEVSADDYYVPTANYNLLSMNERSALVWAGLPFYDPAYLPYDWYEPYQMVYYTNTVLEALPSMPVVSGQQQQANTIKGGALFFRSLAFYELLETFSLPYDSAKSSTQPGILLRLATDINTAYPRASQQACYQQVITDLIAAAQLLPDMPDLITHPSKAAAFGLLSRVYLSIGNYAAALDAASKSLAINPALTDYNGLTNATNKLAATTNYLNEDIFHAAIFTYSSFGLSYAVVDSTLYRSYEGNDLRKSLFFYTYTGNIRFKGSYEVKRNNIPFAGIATDELYLIRAECEARLNDVGSAMADLNTLLINRYKTGTFSPRTAASPQDALTQILQERRKELVFRNTRWKDLRRLNRDPARAITLTRMVNNTSYTLPPGDRRYAIPIPQKEIDLSHIDQNPR